MPNLLAMLLGPSWRTTLLGYAIAIMEAAPSISGVMDGTASLADYRRLLIGAFFATLGRLVAESRVNGQPIVRAEAPPAPTLPPADEAQVVTEPAALPPDPRGAL